MSDIFIEWDRDRVVIAEGGRSGQAASIQRASTIERAADSQDTLDVVDRLKTLFPSVSGKSKRTATIVFPRQLVTVHRVQIPQVPDAEVPDIVRLQASMRLTVPIETVCMDFTPLPVTPGSQTRDIQLVTAPLDQIALVRRTVSDAGLELSEVRVSAYCIAQGATEAGLLTPSSAAGKVDILALMREDFIELTFMRGSAVVFSHSGSSWTSPDGIERAIRSELTRARMSAAESLGEHSIGRLILIGAPEVTAAVTDQLASRLDGATIERIDPSPRLLEGTLPDGLSAIDFVTIAGAMVGQGQSGVETIDLINPRRAPEKRDLRRVKLLAGMLAGLLVFAGGYLWRQSRMTELANLLKAQSTENAEAKRTLDAGEDELKLAESLTAWTDRDIPWLDEMVRLKELLPATDRMFVDKFTFNIAQRNGLCSIKMEAFAKSERDISDLARRLQQEGFAVTNAEPTQKSSAVTDYSWWVALDVVPPVREIEAAATEESATTNEGD